MCRVAFICIAVLFFAILAYGADFIRFYFKLASVACSKVVWAAQGVMPCRPADRGIFRTAAKSVGDAAQHMRRNAHSTSNDISSEKGGLTASPGTSMAKEKRMERVPLRNKVVFTLSIMSWMVSLSGPQLLHVIRIIMDVICYGLEPDLTRISAKHQPSFNAILEQITSLCQQNYVGNQSKTNPEPTCFRAGNSSLNDSKGNSGSIPPTSHSASPLNKELKEKVKEIFFFKFYPRDSLTHFEEWLRNNPEKSESEETILQCAENWFCNVPKEKWLWANNKNCRQLVQELRKIHTDEYYQAWIGIVDVKTKDNVLVIICKNEEYCTSIREAIGDRLIWGRKVEYEVVA